MGIKFTKAPLTLTYFIILKENLGKWLNKNVYALFQEKKIILWAHKVQYLFQKRFCYIYTD